MGTPKSHLKVIFLAALDRPDGPERAAFLDEACGTDAASRLQVESLLRHHAEAGGSPGSADPALANPGAADFTLDASGADTQATLAREPRVEPGPTASLHPPLIVERPGMTIGPYKLLQKIGEGGMGTVFMAEQDKPIRRKVALKVIKPGMDTAQVIARFEAERQALAIMDHPHIARVLDAGATATGRPFFVMELVRGVPITDYCDKNHLAPRERLELFLPVCQAIQHAHQKGIIHRDIKPSNIMVTLQEGKPHAKVIDFGVAKATEQRLTERTMFTEFGAIIGTLEYMSPEQAEMGALDIDTRSDIYSLGVLLYELLTGSTPLEKSKLRQAAYSEILRRIREEEPQKPSTRLSEANDALASISAQRKTEPARLSKLVRGDLDWIVMKALDKDRTRRYETANGFARDIQRHLDGDAVEASPPSATYRLRKFAHRHRAALTTVGAFGVLLVVATTVSAGLAYWANKQRNLAIIHANAANHERARAVKAEAEAKEQQTRAEEEAETAVKAIERFSEVVRDTPELKNNPALRALRQKLLKEPQAFYQRLRDQLQKTQNPTPALLVRLARANFVLGRLTANIGNKEDALGAIRESLTLLQQLVNSNPDNAPFRTDLAQSQMMLSHLLHQTNRLTEARAAGQQCLMNFERLAHDFPSDDKYQTALAGCHSQIAFQHKMSGEITEAIQAFERTQAIQERLARNDPTNIHQQVALSWTRSNLAILQSGHGPTFKAAMAATLTMQQQFARKYPRNAEVHRSLAWAYFNIGLIQSEASEYQEALASYAKAREIQDRLVQFNPAITQYQIDLSSTHRQIGWSHQCLADLPSALAALLEAGRLLHQLVESNPSVTQYQTDLSGTLRSTGEVYEAMKRPDKAFLVYEQARALRERLALSDPGNSQMLVDLGRAWQALGFAKQRSGQVADALACHEQARAIFEPLGRDHPSRIPLQINLAENHHTIGNLLTTLNRPDEAIASYEKTRAIYDQLEKNHQATAGTRSELACVHNNLANIYQAKGAIPQALAAHEQARSIREPLVRGHPSKTDQQVNLAETHRNIAFILKEMGRLDDALASFECGRDLYQRLVQDNPSNQKTRIDLGICHHNIGDMRRRLGQPEEALAAYELARTFYEPLAHDQPGDWSLHNNLAWVDTMIGDLHGATGRLEIALAAHEQALVIRERLALEQPDHFAFQINRTNSHLAIGRILWILGRRQQALKSYQDNLTEVQRLAPAYPSVLDHRRDLSRAWKTLVEAFSQTGRWAEALEAAAQFRRVQADLDRTDPAKVTLDARLAAILGGQAPRDPAERIGMAARSYEKGWYIASARSYEEAFTHDPQLTNDRKVRHGYNAACSAALAARGQDSDHPAIDEAARNQLRRQALDWLRAEIIAWEKLLDSGGAGERPRIVARLEHWKADLDLAGIREGDELAKLPAAERAEFEKLWADVDHLQARARATRPEQEGNAARAAVQPEVSR